MKRTLTKLLASGLACVALLSACQKEPSERLELIAEGMGGGNDTKMYVDGLASYWMTGDRVHINDGAYDITVDGTQAYVDGSTNLEGGFDANNYRIVFPASSYAGHGNIGKVNVSFPRVYHYKTTGVSGSGYQVLDAPLGYEGPATGGKVQMKHLTGALAFKIKGFPDLKVDSIIIYSVTSEGNSHYYLSGYFDVDLSTLERDEEGSGANTYVSMAFDKTELDWYGSETKTVFIPVPVTPSDTYFRIRVVGHYYDTKYVYDRTQTTAGRLNRAELGYVSIFIPRNPTDSYLTTSPYFQTETISGQVYNKVLDETDLRVMFDCCRMSGSYQIKNYILKQGGYHMYGYETYPINSEFSGTIKGSGNGSTIYGLTIVGRSLFTYGNQGEHPNVEGLLFTDVTLSPGSISWDAGTFFGVFYSTVYGELTLNNCHVSNMTINATGRSNYSVGGLIGKHEGSASRGQTLTLSNCSFSGTIDFAEDVPIIFGGLVGDIGRYYTTYTVSNCKVGMTATIDGGTNTVNAGGLFGKIESYVILNASNNNVWGTLTVSGNNSSAAGGYIGVSNESFGGTSSGNSNTMNVTVNGETPTGGITLN